MFGFVARRHLHVNSARHPLVVVAIQRNCAGLLDCAVNNILHLVIAHLIFLSCLGVELAENLDRLRIVHELSVKSLVVLVCQILD